MSRPLGIPVQTLVRWSERGRKAARIVPVAIVDAPPAGTVTLVGHRGGPWSGLLDAVCCHVLRAGRCANPQSLWTVRESQNALIPPEMSLKINLDRFCLELVLRE
jgi:hypothetical protein